jgi:hypothetical protein
MDKINIYRLGEVSIVFNLSMKRIVEFLLRKGYVVEKNKSSVISCEVFNLLKNEFSKNKVSDKFVSVSLKRKNEKYKATLGKPGNYGKLIYIKMNS